MKPKELKELKAKIKELEKQENEINKQRNDVDNQLRDLRTKLNVEENAGLIGKCYKYEEHREDEHIIVFYKILKMKGDRQCMAESFHADVGRCDDKEFKNFTFDHNSHYLHSFKEMKEFSEITRKEYNRQLKKALKLMGLV